MISLPYSKTKRYLTGIDWLMYGLGHINKAEKLPQGNAFQLVLECKGTLDSNILSNACQNVLQKFPLLIGSVKRDFNGAPYWKTPILKRTEAIVVTVSHTENDAEAFALLEKDINTPFASSREHIRFHLIHAHNKSFVGACFDHVLFDNAGAEMFLEMLHNEMSEIPGTANIAVTEPAHLSNWKEKFHAGKQVNRFFRKLSEGTTLKHFSSDKNVQTRINQFKCISFSPEETTLIHERAENEAGYLLFMPYVLARVAQAMNTLYEEKGMHSGDLMIPVTLDQRSAETSRNHVFFNHVSFLFYRLKKEIIHDFPKLLASIKTQMYDQVKAKIPTSLRAATLLMRIVPIGLLKQILRLPFTGSTASFSFATILNSAYTPSTFGNLTVSNIYHFPCIPIASGIGVFFTHYNSRLQCVISYINDVVSNTEADTLAKNIRDALTGYSKP